jgi:hypothetical protein
LRRRGPRLRLRGEARLARLLGRLESLDLVLDRGVEALPLPELPFDVRALGRPPLDDLLLLGPSALELAPAALDLRLEPAHLRGDASVLLRDPVRRVDTVEEVGEARGAEEHLHGLRLVGRVQLHEPLGRPLLGGAQAGAGDPEPPCVLRELRFDLLETDVGAVPRLDGAAELHVDRLDLVEDGLRLRPLRGELSWLAGARAGEHERGRQGGAE